MSRTSQPSSSREVAVFGGGCFWCTEAVFAQLKGIESLTSGYAGGRLPNPSYEKVSLGITNHAEVLRIVFDPGVISYTELLDVFWNTHDPTTLNQQGADIGTQYRSVIFFTTPEQEKLARESKSAYQASCANPIVTAIEPLPEFYPAEEYHQRYYEQNQTMPYCSVIISPKIQKVLNKYPHLLKSS
jgi:peptide-methionine (S)-S-oxide reductase